MVIEEEKGFQIIPWGGSGDQDLTSVELYAYEFRYREIADEIAI